MRQHQFNALAELVGLQITSKATIGAALVLLTGRTQTQAAELLQCKRFTRMQRRSRRRFPVFAPRCE